MYQLINYFLFRSLIKYSFIFHLIVFINQLENVFSIIHQLSANQTYCGLKVNLLNDDQIKISNKHLQSFPKYKRHQKYCDIFINTSIDHLIKLEWLSIESNLQFKTNFNSNQTILLINRNAHHITMQRKQQKDNYLISDNNLLLIRVQKLLNLNNLSIKITNLKIVNLNYKQLINKTYCLNIINKLINLDFILDNLTFLNFNFTNLIDHYLNLNLSSLFNQKCAKISIRMFHNSKLISKNNLDTCILAKKQESIHLIRSTNIIINSIDNLDNIICLNINSILNKINYLNHTNRRKKFKKRNLIEQLPLNYDDNQIDNCLNYSSNNITKLKCFVLFSFKLDFKSADHFCKKILMPYDYMDISLANLTNQFAQQFVSSYLKSKLFHNIVQLNGIKQHQNPTWTVYNGNKKRDNVLKEINNFKFWIQKDQKIDINSSNCMQINSTNLFKSTNCENVNALLCEFNYKSKDTVNSSSILSCGEQRHFNSKIDHTNWHIFGLSKSISQSNQNLNCTFKFTKDKNENGQLELLFTTFNLKTSSFINSCKYDYIEISIKNSYQHTSSEKIIKNRLCSNWNEKIKLLRFIGDEINLNLISSSNSQIREFLARVRLIEQTSLNRKINSNDNFKNSFCSSSNFIYYSNWCYMINFNPQVSYHTAHQICEELNSNLLILSNETDYYTQINLIRNLMLKEQQQQNNQKLIFYGDFWIDNNLNVKSNLINEQINLEKDWLNLEIENKFEKNNQKSKINDCFVLTLDEYHYLTDNWMINDHLTKYSQLSKQNLSLLNLDFENKNLSLINQLIDLNLIKRISCDQRAAFVCQKSPNNSTIEYESNEFKENQLNQIYNQPTQLILNSFNFPNFYDNFLEQYFFVNVTDPNIVYLIQFIFLDIENQKDCLYDYLSIKFINNSNNNQLLDSKKQNETIRICGRLNNYDHNHQLIGQQNQSNNNLTLITLPGQSFEINFKTDYSIKGKGFQLKLNQVHLNWCLNKSSVIQLTSNKTLFFRTPGYPHFTLPNLNCKLIINSESNHRILINLIDIKIDRDKESKDKNGCLNEDFFELQLGLNKSIRICEDFVHKLDDIYLLKQLNAKYFVTFNSSLIINYRSIQRLVGNKFNSNFKGIKFSVNSIELNKDIKLIVPLKYNGDYNEIVSNKSITVYSVGKLHLINYPFNLPNGLSATIYLKAPLHHNIELRSPKNYLFNKVDYSSDYHLNYLNNNCKLNSTNQTSKLQIKIKDNFANLQYSPSKSNQWNLCLENDFNYHSIYQLKNTLLIKSNLHVLIIKLSHNWLPSPFYFRILKDNELINKTHILPLNYTVDNCFYRPCENDGECLKIEKIETVYNNSDKINNNLNPIQLDAFKCKCKKGWFGIFCHLRLCDFKPCNNNGECELNDDYTNFTCHCNLGWSGNSCSHSVSTCDRGNPCNNRGICYLVKGVATCKCFKFYEGNYCEKFRIQIDYKPLSERMFQEPFWLGLVAVLIVLFLIGLVYMLKKKFSERINNFFAEEIERSKTQLALGQTDRSRFSLTSNMALNLGPANMRHSHSSIICKLNNCKQSRRFGGSDTECKTYSNKAFLDKPQVKENGYFSDTDLLNTNKSTEFTTTNRKRFPALLFFSQKIVNSTSSAPLNENPNTDNTNNNLLKQQQTSFEKPRRYSLYDFVIRRQSNQTNSSGLFGFDLKQATNRLTKREKKKHKNLLMNFHNKNKSSTENDNPLRIPNIEIENVSSTTSIPKLNVYDLDDEYNNSDINLDNSQIDESTKLNGLNASNSILNYVITENSQEDEQDTSVQAGDLSNLENRSSISSSGCNTADQQKKLELLQTKTASKSPVRPRNWSYNRTRSEQQYKYDYDFYTPPPTNIRHPSDRFFSFDVSSPRASARRKQFANYKQYSCLNLGGDDQLNDYKINFINDEESMVNKNNLFVNNDLPARRLSAPSGQEEKTNKYQLSQQLLNEQLSKQQQHKLSHQSLDDKIKKKNSKSYSNSKKYNRCNTLDNSNIPILMINDEKMRSQSNFESLSSELIYGTPDLSNYLNLPYRNSLSRQSSPKNRLSPKDYKLDDNFKVGSRIQKSLSAGNNYGYDELNKNQYQKFVLSRMKSAQDFSQVQSSFAYQSNNRSKSPRRLRNTSWPASWWSENININKPTTSSVKTLQQTTNYTSTSSSNSLTNSSESDDKIDNCESIKANTKRRFSPHLILSNTHKLAVQQSLPTPPSQPPINYETAWSNSSNYTLNNTNRKRQRSPTNFYRKTGTNYFNFQELQPTTSSGFSTKKQFRCYSADKDRETKNKYQISTNLLSKNETKYLNQQNTPLYRARSFNTTDYSVSNYENLKKQNKFTGKLSSSSPTTASSSPSLSDLNSDMKRRNLIETNYFNNQKVSQLYKPNQMRPKSPNQMVQRSNSDEKTITNRRAYYYCTQTRRKSRSFERSPTEEEVILIPLQLNKQKLKNQSSSDTALEPNFSLDQQQAAFSSESIQDKNLCKYTNFNRNLSDRNSDRNNNNNLSNQQSSFDSNYFEIVNHSKNITKEEIKNLAKKLERKLTYEEDD